MNTSGELPQPLSPRFPSPPSNRLRTWNLWPEAIGGVLSTTTVSPPNVSEERLNQLGSKTPENPGDPAPRRPAMPASRMVGSWRFIFPDSPLQTQRRSRSPTSKLQTESNSILRRGTRGSGGVGDHATEAEDSAERRVKMEALGLLGYASDERCPMGTRWGSSEGNHLVRSVGSKMGACTRIEVPTRPPLTRGCVIFTLFPRCPTQFPADSPPNALKINIATRWHW